MKKGGIGFFDSGIGGLTVLAECAKKLRSFTAYYYGDNARAPYGNLPPQTIRRYVLEAFMQFEQLKVKAAVVACNTATAVCMDELRTRFSFPIIGTEPALLPAAKVKGDILVRATRATVESGRLRALNEKAQRTYPDVRFHVCACDALAGGIEKGWRMEKLKSYLPVYSPSAVVLGCTHYIYIKKEIAEHYSAPVFDGNEGVASRLVEVLKSEKTDNFIKNFAENRDEQPLLTFSGEKQHFLLLWEEGKKTTEPQDGKTNECSQKYAKNDKKMAKTVHFSQIYFLGSGREINLKKYEQMFVVKQKPEWDDGGWKN